MTADISVIIPICNAAKTLERAIKSVLKQTHENIEIIAVDDGSTDDSLSLLQSFARSDSRVKVLVNEVNSGTLTARINGVRAATGNYLLFLDPDDEFTPDAAEKLLALAERSDADIVHFHLQEYDASGKRVWSWCPPRPGTLRGEFAAVEDLLKNGGHYWNLCLKLFRRTLFVKALENLETFHCIMCEDLYMDLAAELLAHSMYKSALPLYIYHTGTSGVTTVKKQRTLEQFALLTSSLRALELCAKMLPGNRFDSEMYNITVKQCRILLCRIDKELAAGDRKDALKMLQECGYCRKELEAAMKMPLLKEINSEDFLSSMPAVRQLVDLFLPPGTRRRVWCKTVIKRALKKG